MKKLLTLFALVIFLVPSLSFAQTNEEAITALRAEIARLTAMLNGQVVTSVTVVSNVPASCLDLPYMQIGARSENVRKLQTFLMNRPESKWSSGISASGYFGFVTQKALVEFQVANNIVANKLTPGVGMFGPKTRAFVKTLTCTEPEVEIVDVVAVPDNNSNEPVTQAETVVRAPGLYVSLIDQGSSYPVYEAGDLGQILGLRFEAVGMDLNLKKIGLDFTKGDVIGTELLNVQVSNSPAAGQTIISSVNLNSKEFSVDLQREFIITSGGHADLYFIVKVSNTTRLTSDFYQLNIDIASPNNTYALNGATGEKVYLSNPQKFTNQGAWLLDDKSEASLYISSPIFTASYGVGESVKVTWTSSALLEDEKIKVTVLDRSGILGVPVLPSFEVANSGSLDWVMPTGFSTQTGTFAIKLSCAVHDCEATTVNLGIKNSSY